MTWTLPARRRHVQHTRPRPPSAAGAAGAWACVLLAALVLALLPGWVLAQGVPAPVAVPPPAASGTVPATLPASRLAGEWSGPALVGQMQLRLIVLDAERGVVAAALTVGSAQCSGGLDSLGQWQASISTLVLNPYRPEPDAAACEVRVRVDGRGRQAWVSETACGAYRGAGCVFEGQLQAR